MQFYASKVEETLNVKWNAFLKIVLITDRSFSGISLLKLKLVFRRLKVASGMSLNDVTCNLFKTSETFFIFKGTFTLVRFKFEFPIQSSFKKIQTPFKVTSLTNHPRKHNALHASK